MTLLTAAPADADAVRRPHLDSAASAGLASGFSSCVAGDNLKETSDLRPESWWGYDSSWNRYAYVMNNPLTRVDPTGAATEEMWNYHYDAGQQRVMDAPAGPQRDQALEVYKSTIRGNFIQGVVATVIAAEIITRLPFHALFVPDSIYEKNQNEKAPGQSSPLATHEKVDEDGKRTVTTYDEFGDRSRQYELGDGVRHGEGYHEFEYDAEHPRHAPGGGLRSEHIPFDSPGTDPERE